MLWFPTDALLWVRVHWNRKVSIVSVDPPGDVVTNWPTDKLIHRALPPLPFNYSPLHYLFWSSSTRLLLPISSLASLASAGWLQRWTVVTQVVSTHPLPILDTSQDLTHMNICRIRAKPGDYPCQFLLMLYASLSILQGNNLQCFFYHALCEGFLSDQCKG